jgi:DNA-3-methyladenine glycosylase I
MEETTIVGEDGVERCPWCTGSELYRDYHDTEWGFPVDDDVRLFEKIVLEGFQAGLSWLTVLKKRPAFREVFCGFDFEQVAEFDEKDVERLVQDARIIRHRGKIESAINNAQRALELVDEFGSLADYFWSWQPEGDREAPTTLADLPAKTSESTALSKDLKKRGWSFVGPTTAYAFMQAMGMVNDHLAGCDVRERVAR